MTWALHWESSCMPCRAKSNSFLYSASVFWASWRPDPVTTYMDIYEHTFRYRLLLTQTGFSQLSNMHVVKKKKSTRADGVSVLLSKSFPRLGVPFSSSQWIQTFSIFKIPVVKKPCPVALTSIVIKSFEKYMLSALKAEVSLLLDHGPVVIHDTHINQVCSYKNLGVHLDNSLS